MIAALLLFSVMGLAIAFDWGGDNDSDDKAEEPDNNEPETPIAQPGPDEIWLSSASDDYQSDPVNDTDDYIHGFAGNDSIESYGGEDTLIGGKGSDTLHDGAGDDIVFGDEGKDLVEGAEGNDKVFLGDDNDTYRATNDVKSGDDLVRGGKGDDFLTDGSGSDRLVGEQGDDTISALELNPLIEGPDTLEGGAGDDVLSGDDGDIMTGGAGTDQFAAYQTMGLDTDAVVITDFDPTAEQLELHVKPPIAVETAAAEEDTTAATETETETTTEETPAEDTITAAAEEEVAPVIGTTLSEDGSETIVTVDEQVFARLVGVTPDQLDIDKNFALVAEA